MTIALTLEEFLLAAILFFAIVSAIYCFLIHRQNRQGGDPGLAKLLRDEFRESREEAGKGARQLREEIDKAQKRGGETLLSAVDKLGKQQKESLDGVGERVKDMRETVDKQMTQLQQSNEKKLDKMRETVDEKLQTTLEKRLGESFEQVSKRLEAVQKGLGEMQSLAEDVGGLQRVLSNVKTSGTWAEYQLGDILEQILIPDQFQRNVAPKPNSAEQVEYAVRLPGKEDDGVTWLPIDAKFPQEDYQRLLDATDAADADRVAKSTAALVRAIQNFAKDISQKYVAPPHTTDFAIMFLPTEGLYAEVLRQPGLVDSLQHNHRVVVAGPTTLSAILNSLRMGFRTLAIEARSSEVWQVLAAVKTEFNKFGKVLTKVKGQLATASRTIEGTEVRTRAMTRKLREVETLPDDEATELLGLAEPSALPEEESAALLDLDPPSAEESS